MHTIAPVGCEALVLAEVSPNGGFGGGTFVKPGEKVYRRLGIGNFGRVPSLCLQDKLVMSLGTYLEAADMADVVRGFVRNELEYRGFVII